MKVIVMLQYYVALLIPLLSNHGVSLAFSPVVMKKSSTTTSLNAHEEVSSRRDVLVKSLFVTTGVLAGMPTISNAYAQEKADKEKINKGYQRLSYLLDNWEKETTVCNRSDNPYIGCERTPEKVMEYLGYKSMEDPLFRADKTLIRLQALVPANDKQAQNDYQDALDIFIEKAEEGNGMAFISSWGEANPGGGKDRVALFIERSKKDVIESKDALAVVKRILNI